MIGHDVKVKADLPVELFSEGDKRLPVSVRVASQECLKFSLPLGDVLAGRKVGGEILPRVATKEAVDATLPCYETR